MNGVIVPKATLGRLPIYLRYLKSIRADSKNISATGIAKALGYGEVQVRKDLGAVSGKGKPKVGYDTDDLIERLDAYLGLNKSEQAIIVGAGKLGRALLDYNGFSDFGLDIAAAFDTGDTTQISESGKPIYPMEEFDNFCYRHAIRIGIITVPRDAAQGVCDLMVKNNISAVWSFAPGILSVPDHVVLRQENLALSLAYLTKQI
ncbi:MAG: redox-sensing transcriptional repressor Rex [Eubacteriales bacterium]|jgi:redox-sensing transcriptional repressor|nr:redox-sensing transcriptional repressor Rex [Eubacteriales bacterium]